MLLSHMTYSWMKRPDPDPRPSPTPHPPCLPCQRKTKPQTTRTPKINTATAQPSLRLREDREGTARGGLYYDVATQRSPVKKKMMGSKRAGTATAGSRAAKGTMLHFTAVFSPLSDSHPINTLLRRWQTTH